MQPRLERLRGGRALKLMEDRRFRAAYDFLCLRATVDERLQSSASWWTKVQTLPEDKRSESAANRPVANEIWSLAAGEEFDGDSEDDTPRAAGPAASKKKRRRRRRRKPAGDKGAAPKPS